MKTIYSCGPTVYQRAHIGNLRSMAFADSERRKMEAEGNVVKHVINITDIDDKIMAAVKLSDVKFDKNKHLSIIREFTEPIIQQFKQDLIEIGVDITKITFVNATDFLDQMYEYVQSMVNSGIAYVKDGSIVLNTSKLNYKATGNDPDFALWKIDKNRPGWHIECTVMSRIALGSGFDLHTGGIDLKFPHHYNECAQSIAYDGKELCKDFSYCQHLMVEGRKMSKSLHNCFTLEDVRLRGFSGTDLRFLFDKYNYINNLDFTWDKLKEVSKKPIDHSLLIKEANKWRKSLRDNKQYKYSDELRKIMILSNVEVND